MKISTHADLIKSVPEGWKNQYLKNGEWMDPRKEDIYNRLMALEKLNEADIVSIIGNRSWTTQWCDECKHDTRSTHVTLGIEYDSVSICYDCIEKAFSLISENGR